MASFSLAVVLIYLAGCVVQVDASKLGAVASESELCSQYGADMLAKGGTAADSVSLYFLSTGVKLGLNRLITGSLLQPVSALVR